MHYVKTSINTLSEENYIFLRFYCFTVILKYYKIGWKSKIIFFLPISKSFWQNVAVLYLNQPWKFEVIWLITFWDIRETATWHAESVFRENRLWRKISGILSNFHIFLQNLEWDIIRKVNKMHIKLILLVRKKLRGFYLTPCCFKILLIPVM